MNNISPLSPQVSSTQQPQDQTEANSTQQKTQKIANKSLEGTERPSPPNSLQISKTTPQLKDITTQPPVKSRLKMTAFSTGISTLDFICEIVSGAAHGIAKDAATDAKIGIGLTKAIITLPLITVKTAKAIYNSFKIIQLKAQIASVKKSIQEIDIRSSTTETSQETTIDSLRNREKLQFQLEELENKVRHSQAEIFTCKEIPKDLVDIANSCIHFAIGLGTQLKTIPPHILSGLSTAATVLGTVAGGLAIAMGLVDVGVSIRNLYISYKKKRDLDEQIKTISQEIQNLESTSSSQNEMARINATKSLYQLTLMSLIKEREIHKSKLITAAIAIGAGTLVVTTGALAITAAFTGGTTAIILAGVGFGIGIAVTGIKISNYIKNKYDERKIDIELKNKEPQKIFDVIRDGIEKKNLKEDDLKHVFKIIGKDLSDTEIKRIYNSPDHLINSQFSTLLKHIQLASDTD